MPTLSIIIPTLNESKYIEKCLSTIDKNVSQHTNIEIIIIDAGSSDSTLSLLPEGIRVSKAPSFAGNKSKSLNEGSKMALGQYLLFLDADTLVPKNFDLLIKKQFEAMEIVGGAFEFEFDKKLPLLRIIGIINRIRYRYRQSYYGDQGIFVRKEVFDQIGGFPDLRLMEAAHLCQKLRQKGKLGLITTPIITSSRRFEQGGILKVFSLDIIIWVKNFLGMDVQQYARKYWSEVK